MGNRCGLLHRSVSFVSVFSAEGWAYTLLCALTHPLPPKWEIINTHQSNTGPCCLRQCPIWKDTKNLDILMFLLIKRIAPPVSILILTFFFSSLDITSGLQSPISLFTSCKRVYQVIKPVVCIKKEK